MKLKDLNLLWIALISLAVFAVGWVLNVNSVRATDFPFFGLVISILVFVFMFINQFYTIENNKRKGLYINLVISVVLLLGLFLFNGFAGGDAMGRAFGAAYILFFGPVIMGILLIFVYLNNYLLNKFKIYKILSISTSVILILASIIYMVHAIDTCNNYRDLICIEEKVLITQDPSICEKVIGRSGVSTNELKQMCYDRIALILDDKELCKKSAYPSTCVGKLAFRRNDISVCNILEGDSLENCKRYFNCDNYQDMFCIEEKVLITRDPSICEKVIGQERFRYDELPRELKLLCYYKVALVLDDKELCKKSAYPSTCVGDLACKRKDISMCNIFEEDSLEDCKRVYMECTT